MSTISPTPSVYPLISLSTSSPTSPVVSTLVPTSAPVVSTLVPTSAPVVSTLVPTSAPVVSTLVPTSAPVVSTLVPTNSPVVSTLVPTNSPVTSTLAPTPYPTPDFATPFYLDLLNELRQKEEEKNALLQATSNFQVSGPNNTQQNSQCPKPDPPVISKVATNAAELLKQMGGSNPCEKSTAFKSAMDAGGSSDSFNIGPGGIIGNNQYSSTYAKTSIDNQASEKGCGTFMANASNIFEKQTTMQCMLNKCMNSASVVAKAGASILIQTLPLTDLQANNLLKIQSEKQKFEQQADIDMTTKLASLAPTLSPTTFQSLQDFYLKVKQLNLDTYNKTLDSYSRDVTITNSALKVTATTDIKTNLTLTTDVKNKLAAISDSISKDVANMMVSNELGVNSQDPSVRSAIDKNSSKDVSSTSTNIQDITNQTNISTDVQGNVVITAPGKITITNSTIEANAVAKVVVEQIMNQSILNGMEIASKTLNDSSTTQAVVNKVKGLEDYQKSLNEGIKAATAGGFGAFMNSGLFMIVGLIVALGVIYAGYKFFLAKNKSSFGYSEKSGNNLKNKLEWITLILVVVYLGLSIYRYYKKSHI